MDYVSISGTRIDNGTEAIPRSVSCGPKVDKLSRVLVERRILNFLRESLWKTLIGQAKFSNSRILSPIFFVSFLSIAAIFIRSII